MEKTAQAFLAAIVESTDDAVIGKTIDGIILSWNPAAEKMYGHSPEEAIGKSISVLVPSDRSYEVSEILEKIKSGARVDHYETRRMTKGGTEIHVSLTVSPIKDSSGKIIGASTISRNTSERHQMQQALRESEVTFRSVFENSPDGIFFTSPDGRIFKANPAACHMLGRSEQELCELGRDYVVDCGNSRLTTALKEREQTGQFRGELNLKRRDGTIFPVEISSSVYKDSKGNSRTSIIFRDITRRKRLEENLRSSEDRLLDLYENAPNAYFSVGTDGLIRNCNKGAEELLGYSREILVGKPVFDLYVDGPQGKEKAGKVFQKFISGKEVTSEEIQMQKANGSPVWISLSVNALRDADGQVLESRSIVVDISERKKAEEEKEQLIEGLKEALAKVKTLSGLLPICASCKKIRDDKGYWTQIEAYVRAHTEAQFSHGICPECAKKLYPDFYKDDSNRWESEV